MFFSAVRIAALCQAFFWVVPAKGDQPVQLPPFFVQSSEPKFSVWNWGYMSFPGYEVITYCNRDPTNSFVGNIASQLSILHKIAPAAFEAPPSVPTALILMDETQQLSISQDMRQAMAARPDNPHRGSAGLSTDSNSFPQLRLYDSESTAINLVLMNYRPEQGLIIEPDYIEYLMSTRVPRLPAWYVEAMTELYRNADFGANSVTISQDNRTFFGTTSITFSPVTWISDEETHALRKDPTRSRAFLPMSVILQTRPGSSGLNEETRNRVKLWHSQSCLFLQWVLDDRSGARIAALKKYLDFGDHGQRSEKRFRECFGCGFGQIEVRLREFLPKAINESITWYSDPSDIEVTLRDATPAEYARIWGNWELMEIQFVNAQDPLLVFPYVDQAEHTLKGAYKKGERDPGFLAILGLYDVDMKKPEQARPILESAAAARAAYPRVYTELARIRIKEALAKPEGPNGKLGKGQRDSIFNPLREALRLSPPQSDAYLLYALTLANSSETPTPGDLAKLDEGRRYFPDEAELASLVASLKGQDVFINDSKTDGGR